MNRLSKGYSNGGCERSAISAKDWNQVGVPDNTKCNWLFLALHCQGNGVPFFHCIQYPLFLSFFLSAPNQKQNIPGLYYGAIRGLRG